jgi:hypothetical protein
MSEYCPAGKYECEECVGMDGVPFCHVGFMVPDQFPKCPFPDRQHRQQPPLVVNNECRWCPGVNGKHYDGCNRPLEDVGQQPVTAEIARPDVDFKTNCEKLVVALKQPDPNGDMIYIRAGFNAGREDMRRDVLEAIDKMCFSPLVEGEIIAAIKAVKA